MRDAPLWIRSDGAGAPDAALLHGFGADRLGWLATLPALPGRYHLADLPGHGRSLDVPVTGLQGMAGAVVGALEALAAGPLVLIGHSLGGGLALLIARKRPDLVAGLFLIAPAGLGRGPDEGFLSRLPACASEAEMRGELARLVADPRVLGREAVQYALDQLSRPGARAALAETAGALRNGAPALAEATGEIARSDMPRQVIWGGADRIAPPDRTALADFGTHEILSDTGHLPHVEAARAVNAHLRRFLGALPGSPA